MIKRNFRAPLWSLALLGALVAPSWTLAGAMYTLKDLGTLPGGTSSLAYGVNNLGQVVGSSFVGGISTAFISGPHGGALRSLLPGQANGVNDAGQVVGITSNTQGFITDPNGGTAHLLPSNPMPAYGINASGQVTGSSSSIAFLTEPGGSNAKLLLPLPAGARSSAGYAVNDSGQVAGSLSLSNGDAHAFLSDPKGGTVRDLGTLGGRHSIGYCVNSLGQVTGYAYTSRGQSHAFLSDPNGGALHDLGVLGRGSLSEGLGINASGQVVGWSQTVDGGGWAPFIYSKGVMTNLNSLIDPISSFYLIRANAISDNGYITGYGYDSQGRTRAFLLIPNSLSAVPEPSTLLGAVFAAATTATIAVRRGRGRSQGLGSC